MQPANTITFTGFSGTFTPATDLDTIFYPVLIDGYTAAGASVNKNGFNQGSNAVITVEIKGPGAGVNLPVLNGLRLGVGSDGSIIRGLSINNFANVDPTPAGNIVANGLRIDSTGNTITGNFIGLDTTGVTPFINCRAIAIRGDNNTIGGVTPDTRNVVVGAVGFNAPILNVSLQGAVIAGNLIGLTKNGDVAPITGTIFGIITEGGEIVIDNNVIAGHSAANILFFIQQFALNLQPQTLTNNLIGTDVTGRHSIAPQGVGILAVSFADLPICFTISGNILSGNTYGIILGQNGYLPIIGATVTGNFIGTDINGSLAVPNLYDGILIDNAINTFIGSNLISGNEGNGFRSIKGKNTTIKSNLIGTDVTGLTPIPNGLNGIQLGNLVAVGVPSFGDIVGGALAGEGNLIANNKRNGIAVVSFTQQETIQGNTIINNVLNGIRVGPCSSHNWIGGFRDKGNNLLAGDLISQGTTNMGPLGTTNFIQGNGLDGIAVVQSNDNAIQTNDILNNALVGISLVDSSENLVGGKFATPMTTVPPTLGNSVTNNSGPGVAVVKTKCGPPARENTILSNSIADNGKDGIEFIKQ